MLGLLLTAGAPIMAPADLGQSFGTINFFIRSAQESTDQTKVVFPLHRGTSHGQTVFYVLTEASDHGIANSMGINYAPKLLAAAGTAAVQVVLASGQFGGVDGFHKGEGKALVVQLPDGERFVRFENFKVTNGPDLYVYLSGHPAPRNGAQLHEISALEVGRLKGNIGNQNYPLPAGTDISKFKSVVIYCKQFSVIFSTAQLASNR